MSDQTDDGLIVDIEQARAERSIANDPAEQHVTIVWYEHGYSLHLVDHTRDKVDDDSKSWLADQLRYIASRIETELPVEKVDEQDTVE